MEMKRFQITGFRACAKPGETGHVLANVFLEDALPGTDGLEISGPPELIARLIGQANAAAEATRSLEATEPIIDLLVRTLATWKEKP